MSAATTRSEDYEQEALRIMAEVQHRRDEMHERGPQPLDMMAAFRSAISVDIAVAQVYATLAVANKEDRHDQ